MEQENAVRAGTVIDIPLTELYPFPNHPFKVREDNSMMEMVESVKDRGVLSPVLVRPRPDGGYEIVSGHRRKMAAELAELATLPCLVRELTDDEAIILMVDSNLQRENILPSERARAYKMKLEAIKRRTGRHAKGDAENEPKISARLRSDDEIGAEMGVSGDTIRNYIALTQLVPQLQQMVDDKKIAMSPAYHIASLKPEEQSLVLEAIEHGQAVPTLAQAKQLKKVSQTNGLDRDAIQAILLDDAPPKQIPATQPKNIPPKPAQPAEGITSPPKPERKRGQIAADILELKDTTKDCRCTPDSFLSTFQAVAIRLAREIEVFTMSHYEAVFPSLTPEQLDLLNQHISIIRTAADNFYNKVKGVNEHE